jgi:hypothetical protein
MSNRRDILEEAARLADFYAAELEQLAADATPSVLNGHLASVQLQVISSHKLERGRHLASANTARVIAAELRGMIDHPLPEITERAAIVAQPKPRGCVIP